MASEQAIALRGLTKDHGGGRGVFELDLEVSPGEVFGFLGPNGAGKTTTIRTIMGSLRPTRGEARVFGLDCVAQSVEVKKLVGFLPGELPQFDALRGDEVVGYLGALRGGVERARVASLAERLELDLGRPYREYSRGNKQKLGLVVAMMHRPRLLILDEPTGGLDPLKQQTFNELVLEAKREGATVFLSSHVLSEVEHTCDRFAIIRAGRLARVGDLADLRAMRAFRVEFDLEPTAAPALSLDALRACPGVDDVRVEQARVRCLVREDFSALLALLSTQRVRNLTSTQPSLEELFLTFYDRDGSPAKPALAAEARS